MIETTRPIEVLIVDDHMMVRDGLKLFLSIYSDIAVIGEAADGAEALDHCRDHPPDVILMDMVMPYEDGPTITARIRAAFPQVQVIALTSFADAELLLRVLRAGAIGYLLKDVHADELAEAIRKAHHGQAVLDAATIQSLAQLAVDLPAPGHDLTEREREVLTLLVAGKTNGAIATQLAISSGTVRLHVSHILAKLGVSNRTEAAILAVRHKLVP
jgi:two-component system, NarL family, response regulator LiaR